MSFKRKIQNGVVVLPPDITLPEGIAVNVEPVEAPEDDPFIQAVLKSARLRPHWPKGMTKFRNDRRRDYDRWKKSRKNFQGANLNQVIKRAGIRNDNRHESA